MLGNDSHIVTKPFIFAHNVLVFLMKLNNKTIVY